MFDVFNDLQHQFIGMYMIACVCVCCHPLHIFSPDCSRAETERGLNRKHIIEGNKSIFLSSALSFTSPHHLKPHCTPVISFFYLLPSLFLPVCVSSVFFDIARREHPAEFESCISRRHRTSETGVLSALL